jgi:hypothetical protein
VQVAILQPCSIALGASAHAGGIVLHGGCGPAVDSHPAEPACWYALTLPLCCKRGGKCCCTLAASAFLRERQLAASLVALCGHGASGPGQLRGGPGQFTWRLRWLGQHEALFSMRARVNMGPGQPGALVNPGPWSTLGLRPWSWCDEVGRSGRWVSTANGCQHRVS